MPFPDAALSWIPLVMLLLSLAAAIAIFPMPEDRVRLRATVNLVAASLKVLLVVLLFPVVLDEDLRPEFSLPFLPGIDLVLRVDPLALFFAALSSVLWLLTTVYAIGYLRGREHRSRFFGFFSLCVAATVGISFSGNLITFLVFYELLTLSTYPLVAHWGDRQSLRAARIYLRYTITGGLALLAGVVLLTVHAGPVDFADGGAEGMTDLAARSPSVAIVVFVLLIGGLGVKAALFPLHGWLPLAMVAPAPVSALLHAVAVVKAGVFGIVRVVDDVYGIQVARELGVLTPLLVLAAFTIVYGSYHALRQVDLKKRLAYSTISQLSYVVLGLTLATAAGTAGGVVHLVHQGIMKVTLFFCAGLFTEVLGAKRVDQLDGLGRRMPGTSIAFTVGALGMMGLPPTAGFISKWQLGLGALDSAHPWALAILLTSSLLNAAYFLPVVYRLWFGSPQPANHSHGHAGKRAGPSGRVAEPKALLVPALVTAALVIGFGLAASAPYSPLYIAEDIARRVFE
ncbi:monovalent cation/H+ antiporter subunit D family protein [Cellulosimicrobium funkei]|nr:monovalent cation/H+ antiporter subunit D family protein [Cellulosimicrobium funkei]